MTENETLFGKDLAQLSGLCNELGMPRFAARQLARWLYARRTEEPARMSDIAQRFREALAARFTPALTPPERVDLSDRKSVV